MKINDKVVDFIMTGSVSGLIAIVAAAGFSSPREKMADHEARIKTIESAVATMAVGIGKMDQKIDDLVDGLGVARRHAAAYDKR